MNKNHRLISFRTQRTIFALVVFGLIGLYTLSVQWSHVDQSLAVVESYSTLIKLGLASDLVIILFLLIWELFARDHNLTLACFGTVIFLEIVCVIHAGAILQLDTGHARQSKAAQDAAEHQVRLATEIEKARIAATADAAAKLNQLGQTQTARRIAGTIGKSTSTPIAAPTVEADPVVKSSFLPSWYLNGAQYFVTILLGYLGFAFCFFVSRGSLLTEDEPVATSGKPANAPAPAPAVTISHPVRTAGFVSGNLQPVGTADPKDSPR